MIYRVLNSQCAMRNAQLFNTLELCCARIVPQVTFTRALGFIHGQYRLAITCRQQRINTAPGCVDCFLYRRYIRRLLPPK